jgi:hypothetical protein
MIEMSAMERDIFLCTGFVPDKLRTLCLNYIFEGKVLLNLLSSIKYEGTKVSGVNQPIIIQRHHDVLIIGRSSKLTLIEASKDKALRRSMYGGGFAGQTLSTEPDQRIKIDLAKVHDRVPPN